VLAHSTGAVTYWFLQLLYQWVMGLFNTTCHWVIV